MLAPFVDPSFQQGRPIAFLPLVGRSTEMQLISSVLATVADNVPRGTRTLTISGDIGIGKSRLLAEACHVAFARDFRVLQMVAYESSSDFPYFLFVEALRPVLSSVTREQLRCYVGLTGNDSPISEEMPQAEISLTGIPLITSLARLFPELPTLVRVQPHVELLSPEQEKFRLFDSIATLLERLSTEKPLLLSIDNMQWADTVSLELILYLIIRLRTSRVALIGATRPQANRLQSDDEAQKAAQTVTRVLAELMQQGMWLPLPLGALETEAVVAHVHALLPGVVPDSIAQSLLVRAEGNPFFLEELVRSLTLHNQLFLHEGTWFIKQSVNIKLPENILVAVRQRLHALSPACFDLLCIAALFGRSFPKDVLMQVASYEVIGQHDNKITALLDEAIQASLLTNSTEQGYEEPLEASDTTFHIPRPQLMFCQTIVQEVLLDTLPVQRVRHLHYVIGQALEQYYAHDAARHASELATHYVASTNREKAVYWSLLAGEEAVQQQSYHKAINHFRFVLRFVEDADGTLTTTPLPALAQLYLTIGELWFKLGEFEQATSVLQSALERADTLPPLLQARINRTLADVYRMQAQFAQALSHLQAAGAALEGQHVTRELEQEHTLPWFFRRGTSATSTITIERVNSAERILLLQAQATLDVMLNHPREAEEGLWQAHQLATSLGDRASQAFSLHLIGWIYGWGERIHEAILLQQQAHELYLAIGDPFRAALGEQGLGIIYQALGEIETARLHTRHGFELARQYGVRRVIGWLYWNQGVIALSQGDWAECATQLQLAAQEASRDDTIRLKPIVLQAQAMMHFRRGLWSDAERLFQDAIQAATNTDWFASSVALYGHFLAVTGRRAAAHTQLDRARVLPETTGFSGTFYIPFLAEGYLHLDTVELATPYFERIAKLRGFLYYSLSVDRVIGELAALMGDWDAAEKAFDAALQLCRRANNRPEEATVLYEQARMAVMRGEAVPRIRLLCEQARELFLRYDMQRAATLVDTLLEGVQDLEPTASHEIEHVPVKSQSVRTSEYVIALKLTMREREVLQLVAEGHTDREVADSLVLSPRTVNRHLSNILVKLNVPGRAAAVAYAIRQGLV